MLETAVCALADQQLGFQLFRRSLNTAREIYRATQQAD